MISTCPYKNFALRADFVWAQKENNLKGMCIHDHSSMANLGSGWAKFTYFLPIYLFYLDQTGKKPLILEDLFYFFFSIKGCIFPVVLPHLDPP